MIRLDFLKGKTVVVLGLGRSGIATAKALVASQANVVTWDDGVHGQHLAHDLGFILKAPDDIQWASVDLLVFSPGIPLTHPAPHPVALKAQAHHVPIVCDIDLLLQAQPEAAFVGITGTNGKSTTTVLASHLLKEAGFRVEVGGNLGIAVLDLEPLGAGGIYVLELSSFQLELMHTAHLDIAVLINITPDHLDRHGSMDGYIAVKKHIFSLLRPQGVGMIGVDDPYTLSMYDELKSDGRAVIPFSVTRLLPEAICVQEGVLADHRESSTLIDLNGISTLRGQHNWQNAAAAYAIAHELGVDSAKISQGMTSFKGLAHRQEYVATLEGVSFINDSKATNADATSWALMCYQQQPLYWIVGGRPKEGGIDALLPYFKNIRHVFLIGEAASSFALTLEGHVAITHSGTMDQAIKDAFEQALHDKGKGPVVLLAPSCTSYDQYKSFEERGDHFRRLVLDKVKQQAYA